MEFSDDAHDDFKRVLRDVQPNVEGVCELSSDIFSGAGQEVVVWPKENLVKVKNVQLTMQFHDYLFVSFSPGRCFGYIARWGTGWFIHSVAVGRP